jgi:spore maturation protein CgeB
MRPGEFYFRHLHPARLSALSSINRLRIEAEMRLGLKPMTPPAPKVEKSRKIKKILFISPTEASGFGHPVSTYMGALKELADTAHIDFESSYKKDGKRKMNETILREVERSSPDLVFFFLYTDEFYPETIRRITRDTSSITFNCFADDEWRFESYTRFWAGLFDFCSTTHKPAIEMCSRLGQDNVIFNPWSADPAVFRKMGLEKRFDVSFVGMAYPERKATMARLAKKGVNVECFGGGWPAGPLGAGKMTEVINRSRINLNLSRSIYRGVRMMKSRPFEVASCGSFLLSENFPDMGECFESGKEMAFFEDEDELAEKVRYYLAHDEEREAMAEAAHARLLKEHTSMHRVKRLFAWMESKI